jgi:hypothetical protein
MDTYLLDAKGEPIAEPDLLTWAKALESQNRQVARDEIGDVRVSTVFLGLDHSFGLDGPPILWETMIFGGPHDQYQERYSTRANAIAGHARALALVRS